MEEKEIKLNKEVWNKIINLGRKNEGSSETGQIINHLTQEQVTTIIDTMKKFDAEEEAIELTYSDLTIPKFKVFDWLGMCVDGRINLKNNEKALKVLVFAYLKAEGDANEFINLLEKNLQNPERKQIKDLIVEFKKEMQKLNLTFFAPTHHEQFRVEMGSVGDRGGHVYADFLNDIKTKQDLDNFIESIKSELKTLEELKTRIEEGDFDEEAYALEQYG